MKRYLQTSVILTSCLLVSACGQRQQDVNVHPSSLTAPTHNTASAVQTQSTEVQTESHLTADEKQEEDGADKVLPVKINHLEEIVSLPHKEEVVHLDLTYAKIPHYDFLENFTSLKVLELPLKAPLDDPNSDSLDTFLRGRDSHDDKRLVILFNPFASYVAPVVKNTYKRARFIESTNVCELYRQIAYRDGAITFSDLFSMRWTSTYPIYDFNSSPKGKRLDIFLFCNKDVT